MKVLTSVQMLLLQNAIKDLTDEVIMVLIDRYKLQSPFAPFLCIGDTRCGLQVVIMRMRQGEGCPA